MSERCMGATTYQGDHDCVLPKGHNRGRADIPEYHQRPSGPSVPEAARAAARKVAYGRWNSTGFTMGEVVDGALSAAAPHIVAAASVELQQEVDRLSAECEALRGTVAEERTTTGRAADLADMWDQMAGEASLLATSLAYRWCAKVLRAALASPGEGE